FGSGAPPGTSVREPGSPWPASAGPAGGGRAPRSRALLIAGFGGLLDLVGEERREVGEFVEAGQTEPFQEVAGRPVQDRAGLALGAGLLDQAAQGQGAHHRVAVDA